MSVKKVMIVIGSPRKNGNCVILAQRVAKGAEAMGAKVESFYLYDMVIKPCSACDECLESDSTDCTINDDMQGLYPKLREADALVIASPIYFGSVTAQTKPFLDRWHAFGGPQEKEHTLKGKRIGIILTYGDSDPFNSGAVNAIRTFQDIFAYTGSPIVGMVYGSARKAGEIQTNRDLLEKAYKLGEQLISKV